MPCKHEDLSSDLLNSGKLDSVPYICYPTHVAAVTARPTQQGMTMRSWISSKTKSNTQYCFLASTCMLWLRQACSSSLWRRLMIFYSLYTFLEGKPLPLLPVLSYILRCHLSSVSLVCTWRRPWLTTLTLSRKSNSFFIHRGFIRRRQSSLELTPCLMPVLSLFPPRLQLLPPLVSQSRPERSRQRLLKFLLMFAFSQLHMNWKYS